MKNILLCTLGASWAVIPEAYGFLAPQQLPLYRHHPQQATLDKLRGDYQLQAPMKSGFAPQKVNKPKKAWNSCNNGFGNVRKHHY